MISFGIDVCGNCEQAAAREWLETNGLGGYASSTIAGQNTRRYHGLLVAATDPPVARALLLSKLDEVLIVDGHRYELSTNQYPGAIYPQGFRFLTDFRLDPFPTSIFDVGSAKLEKRVFMPSGENTVVVQYRITARQPEASCQLEIRPLVAFRDHHALTRESGALAATVQQAEGLLSIQPYPGLPKVHFAHDATQVSIEPCWYRNFEYPADRERGLDFTEDLFNPFSLLFDLLFDLTQTAEASIIASLEPHSAQEASGLRATEITRRSALTSAKDSEFASALKLAANQFIVKRGAHKTIIAGYHWFCDWGRDTMIALPGLTLSTRRFDVARDILETFAASVSEGMIPNRFPDHGEQPEYNTVDASLWFFNTVQQYLDCSGDEDFVRQRIFPILVDMIDAHIRGTRFGIRMDEDGLLTSGQAGVQLTWMDAKIGDWVVTPRQGKPVEIQALWYNALRIVGDLAARYANLPANQRCNETADRALQSFNAQFWHDELGCLYDVVNGNERDASLRPNQVFAISLRHSMVEKPKAAAILKVVERELLTPYGLRTLSSKDPKYRGRFEGDLRSRDAAYHQGTVWPWLLGAYVDAYLKTHGSTAETLNHLATLLQPFKEHIHFSGLGQISEVFDGDPPHLPGGCIAQAWSVAEILRIATILDQNAGRGKNS